MRKEGKGTPRTWGAESSRRGSVDEGLLELSECPALDGVAATPACVLDNQVGQGEDAYSVLHCLLLCTTSNGDDDCPPSLACVDLMQMGLGVCGHP